MRLVFLPLLILAAERVSANRAGGRVQDQWHLQLRDNLANRKTILQRKANLENTTVAVQQAAAAAASAVASAVGQTVESSAKSTAVVQQAVVAAADAAANVTVATAATAGAAKVKSSEVPGTPFMEQKMPLRAPEQGFQGKDVQHKDKETQTGDWQKEFGKHEAPLPAAPVKNAGARSASALCLVLTLVVEVMLADRTGA